MKLQIQELLLGSLTTAVIGTDRRESEQPVEYLPF